VEQVTAGGSCLDEVRIAKNAFSPVHLINLFTCSIFSPGRRKNRGDWTPLELFLRGTSALTLHLSIGDVAFLKSLIPPA
jgi:hypothetical protein